MKSLQMLMLTVVVFLSSYLGFQYPLKSIAIAPHAITVSAILAGIIGAAQNLLGERMKIDAKVTKSREKKVELAEAEVLSRGLYDQLAIYVLVIIFAIIVIWLQAETVAISTADRVFSAMFMAAFALAVFLTIRMPEYLKSLSS